MRKLLLGFLLLTACGKSPNEDKGVFSAATDVANIVGLWKLEGIAFEKLTDQISISGLHYLQNQY